MKVERRDPQDEKRIILAMIVDKSALGRIASKWEPDLFRSKWSNLVGSWCVKHFNDYGRSPGKTIESIFRTWANGNKDEQTVLLVERFLQTIDGEYKKLAKESNSDYIVDLAAKHFSRIKALRLAEQIQDEIGAGHIDTAIEAIEKFNRVKMGEAAGIDVLRDVEAWKAAFSEQVEPLIEYPEPLDRFFRKMMVRDAFVSFEGPEKRGKSWWLQDTAWMAMTQRRKVAFFEVGDMSQNQIMRRFGVRAARIPLDPGEYLYPTSLAKGKPPEVEHETRKFKKGLSWRDAIKACEKTLKTKIRSKETMLKLACYPNSSISIKGIEAVLDGWDREGWIPDVIVIDYADILLPIPGVKDKLDQVNETWKYMRRISQERHCLVVTATQTNRSSYDAHTISKKHAGEDKRKHGQVTAMIGINQTETEKELGLMRLNTVALREGDYYESRCLHVAGCLGLARPWIKAVY